MRKRITIMLALLLCACTANAQEPAKEPEPAATERITEPYAAKEVTDTFAWIGRTAAEVGIGQESIDGYGNIVFTADLFGHTVTGTAYLMTDFSDPDRVDRVHEIWLTDGISEMQTTEAALSARFGDPYAAYEEPYVESNGGVTYHQYYWTGEGVVALSNGAKNDFYEFSYSVPEEIPAEIAKRTAGLTTEELGHRTGVYFHFGEGEAEDLQIEETTYDAHEAYLVTFAHDGADYRVTIVPDGEALFDTLSAGGGWTEIRHELQQSRCRTSGEGGTIVEKNAFGQCWIIETDGPGKGETLAAFEEFLLNRWLY